MKRGLARLAVLYAKVEQLRGIELRVALDAVEQVEQARAAAIGRAQQMTAEGRDALSSGDRSGWACAETMRYAEEASLPGLAELQAARQRSVEEARDAHRESRLKTEQLTTVVERAQREQAILDGRREQGVADDRYAARTAWMEQQQRRTEPGT